MDGSFLAGFCFHNLPDTEISADQLSANARRLLHNIRESGGPLTAYSVCFIRGHDLIGSWSLDREHMSAE